MDPLQNNTQWENKSINQSILGLPHIRSSEGFQLQGPEPSQTWKVEFVNLFFLSKIRKNYKWRGCEKKITGIENENTTIDDLEDLRKTG